MSESERSDSRSSRSGRVTGSSSPIQPVDPKTIYQQSYVPVPLPASATVFQTVQHPYRYTANELQNAYEQPTSGYHPWTGASSFANAAVNGTEHRSFHTSENTSMSAPPQRSPPSASSTTASPSKSTPVYTDMTEEDDQIIDMLLRDRQCLSEGCVHAAIRQLTRTHVHPIFLKRNFCVPWYRKI